MERKNMCMYESPRVEIIEVEVEQGFLMSEPFGENGNPVQGN